MRILYLDIDTLRPDHLPAYGYDRPTAPAITQLAQEGVTFSECYVSDSPCVPSRAALVSGRFGIHNGVVTHWGAGAVFRMPVYDGDWDQVYAEQAPLFPRYLRAQGFHTATISSFADKHQAPWYLLGWAEVQNFTLKRGNEDAEEVAERAIAWLREHGTKEDWFLHVHFWDPHKNYTMDPAWAQIFRSYTAPGWPDAQTIAMQQDPASGPGSAADLWGWGDRRTSPVPTMPHAIRGVEDLKHLVDGYDGAIRYLDSQIERLLDCLNTLGIRSETAVIVTSDHGESFGEHGLYAQHADAGTAVHHVPLIIQWPGLVAGVSCSRLVYLQDIVPTMMELLGRPLPEGWDFHSFAQVLDPARHANGTWDHLVWGHGLYVCQRAVFQPPWFYIRTYHPGVFRWDDECLYHVDLDPHETRNQMVQEPGILSQLRAHLAAWIRDKLGEGQMDPMEEVVRTGGPYRYVKPEPWMRHLQAIGEPMAAERIRHQERNPW